MRTSITSLRALTRAGRERGAEGARPKEATGRAEVDAMSDELRSVRCPGCYERLEYAAEDWHETPAGSERHCLEWHIKNKHDDADDAAVVRWEYLTEVSALPRRFLHPAQRPTEEPAATVWNEAAAWYRDCLGDSNLILYGGTGVGKSTLAARMLLRSIEDEANNKLVFASIPYWLHVGDFARRARRLLATGRSAELAEILDRAQQADYLFLDDLGSERPTEFVRDLVADPVEHRYDHTSYGAARASRARRRRRSPVREDRARAARRPARRADPRGAGRAPGENRHLAAVLDAQGHPDRPAPLAGAALDAGAQGCGSPPSRPVCDAAHVCLLGNRRGTPDVRDRGDDGHVAGAVVEDLRAPVARLGGAGEGGARRVLRY
jgi:DNA replication protein DnaC